MTTTELYSGLGEGERNSSRVLRPPGGGSSNIFGNAEPEEVKVKDYYRSDIFHQKDDKPSQDSPKAGQPVGAAAAPFASDAAPPPAEAKPSKPVTSVSSPIAPPPPEAAQARPAKRAEGAVNPITGEAVAAPPAQPKKEVHTSIKMRHPPGGASSGPLW